MKRFLALMVSLVLCVTDVCAMSESEGILYEETKAGTEESAFGELEISTPSAVLMEVSTGKVIYEKAADEQLPPASVTKVMTLLLIFDALEDEKIKLTDIVIRIGVCGVHGWLAGVFRAGRDTDCGYDDKMYCGGECERCLCGNGRAHMGQ